MSPDPSRAIANAIAKELGAKPGKKLQAQTSGDVFESAVTSFLDLTFRALGHLRPGKWSIRSITGRKGLELSGFDQYRHLQAIALLAKQNPEIAVALGNDYLIAPDIVVGRSQEDDGEINRHRSLVGKESSKAAALRVRGERREVLHASISCKWTIRSDRAQNSRSEALNLIRNRKGRTPHIAVVTGEPLPTRISSLALGTGDIDCVYHFALYELVKAVEATKERQASELVSMMIEGDRLKDISDLPLDLAV
ncbi:MAG: NgoMIV family type II restriction endonuclease [Aestuariivirga sp.]